MEQPNVAYLAWSWPPDGPNTTITIHQYLFWDRVGYPYVAYYLPYHAQWVVLSLEPNGVVTVG